jgi:hypothetical protein
MRVFLFFWRQQRSELPIETIFFDFVIQRQQSLTRTGRRRHIRASYRTQIGMAPVRHGLGKPVVRFSLKRREICAQNLIGRRLAHNRHSVG